MIHTYLTISLMIFSLYLIKFLLDDSTNVGDSSSWIALLIASIFWPILLPISGWELSQKS
ncbi:MAG: hypothetical protein AAFY63_14610 [Cyanobacteria bacterium J06643_13]